MTPQELKNSILQLAIQGKLVEQRPEEGTAEELYQQIQAEKQKLIKEKKIKKDNPLPEITDNEKPFDIPESWKWVRIGQIFGLQAGKNISANEIGDSETIGHKYLCYGGNGVRGYVDSWNREGHYAIIGRQGALCGNINWAKGFFYATEHAVVVDHYNLTDVAWCGWFLRALNLNQYATATAQPGLAVANIVKVLLPLPPLAEQKRIVAKIEQLLPLIDRYEAAWSRLEAFNKRFPADMQKSILQEAIQGRLVEQRPEEGTGEELYQQIQAEKQRLIADKKIKKEKPLPEITEDEKPFEIPESWKWVKLATISSKITDGEHKTPHRVASYCGYYLLSARNVRNGFISLDDVDYVDQKEFEQLSKRCNPQCGDILISCSGSVGRCAVICDDNNYVMVRSAAMVSPILLDSNYLMFAVRSSVVQDQIKHRIKQTAQANLFQDAIRNLIVPLPPLAEQKRIVAKIEQLLPLCEKLK